jgi:hypothetical protein
VPRGNFPNDKLVIGPRPRFREVSCAPGGSHAADFEIVSGEG